MPSLSPGRFWAVGVGPGDPGLLTTKAVQVLRQVHTVYHAGPEDSRGRALDIIRHLLRPEQATRKVLTVGMGEASASDGRSPYRPGVEQIAADCRRGRDVAFITEGDPTLYSTAAPVWQLLAELHPDIPIEIVPGVSSITAAAARIGWPLAQRDETLLVVPARYYAGRLRSLIAAHPGLCLLKCGSALPQLTAALRELGPEYEAAYVEELGTDREWITHDLASAAGRDQYFSLVLVRRKPEAPARAGEEKTKGQLWVVGIGPGAPDLLTRQAWQALYEADDVVGYDAYLKQLEPLGLWAEVHGFPIGAEAERVARALELARQGRRVALVSSGDAGVYGMASLMFETAGQVPEVAVEIIPGVTAATAAASLLGAPLGHDFACISLSDLLTPWEVIEQRLEAAGRGDFVVALYNPISQRRTWQLGRARDILLQHRRPETPVGMVTCAYRPGTRVAHTTLSELTGDGVTMETTVIVGSSQTRIIDGRMVTPRGYGVASVGGAHPTGHGKGRQIMEESFAIIEREVGPHSLPPWVFAVVRRMIHASADFEFAQTIRYSPDFEAAIRAAFRERVPIVTDTEMVLLGIRTALTAHDLTLACYLNDPEASAIAEPAGLTRSAAGVRLAAQKHARPLLVIGNAPTALDEALRLVEEANWRPAAIIGMPVGFVGVVEAKSRLLGQSAVPYLSCVGRKGGSAVAAAAVNALVEWVAST